MVSPVICATAGPTIPEFAETYYSVRLVDAPAKTLANYRLAVRHWDSTHPGLPVSAVDRLAISKHQQRLAASHSPSSVNAYLRPIMAILRLAAEEDFGLLERVPKIRMLREPKRAPLALTIEEFSTVLAVAAELNGTVAGYPAPDWWAAVLLTCWETGLRLRSLMLLRTVDLLWDESGVYSQAESAKNKKADWFPLQATTLDAIRKICDPLRERLFPRDVEIDAIGRRFRKLLDASGIYAPRGSGMRFHRLRRSKASYTELAGGDAQRALGHSARSVTERYLDPRIVGRVKQPSMPMPT